MHCTTLANGLRVASREMRSVETVAVGLYAATGSRFEAPEKNGLAHLFEHMVFKGAGGRSARQISETIEDAGGDLNASTDREITGFYASLLAPDLALGVGLLADLIRRPHFDPAHLELEKKVVLQELAEANDTGGDLVFDRLQDAAFPGQPLGLPVLGSAETLSAITVENLHDWRETQFAPSNLVLVAAGKLQHARLVELAEAAFEDMVRGSRPCPAPAQFVGGLRTVRKRGQQAHVAVAMAAPAWGDEDAYAAQLFADVAGGGSSSRLFQQLREDHGLAYCVSAAAIPFSDAGLFYAYAAVERDDAESARKQIEQVLAECVEDIDQRDLERARAMAKAGMLMSLESCWGQAYYVATRLLREGELIEPARIVERLDAVTLDQVRAAGRKMLAGPRAVSSVGAKLALAA